MENLKEQTVLFDPGFAQHTTILSQAILSERA